MRADMREWIDDDLFRFDAGTIFDACGLASGVYTGDYSRFGTVDLWCL